MLRPGVTQDWVDKGRLPKKRTKLKATEALRYAGRGHIWRNRSMSLSHENMNAMEISPRGDIVQWIMVEQLEAIQHTREKSHKGLDHTELDCSKAYIRLRVPDKSEDKAEDVEAGGRKERGSDDKSIGA
ncbi:hypothetical protein B296_00009003 [Ensete ventricosum]|uniref:Uncharacterized protein n=1 Tax=Ensete ventricosum TaxID=4639 RepID=A0A427BAP5_ENSVE|nr:hypothetical protein B296_00009003 [Ensete ventricosum]